MNLGKFSNHSHDIITEFISVYGAAGATAAATATAAAALACACVLLRLCACALHDDDKVFNISIVLLHKIVSILYNNQLIILYI